MKKIILAIIFFITFLYSQQVFATTLSQLKEGCKINCSQSNVNCDSPCPSYQVNFSAGAEYAGYPYCCIDKTCTQYKSNVNGKCSNSGSCSGSDFSSFSSNAAANNECKAIANSDSARCCYQNNLCKESGGQCFPGQSACDEENGWTTIHDDGAVESCRYKNNGGLSVCCKKTSPPPDTSCDDISGTCAADCSALSGSWKADSSGKGQCGEQNCCVRKGKTEPCQGKSDGDSCQTTDNKIGACFNEKCRTEPGKKGEKCGSEGSGTCQSTDMTCLEKISASGAAGCESSLICCNSPQAENACFDADGECVKNENCESGKEVGGEAAKLACEIDFGDSYVCCEKSVTENICQEQGGECKASCKSEKIIAGEPTEYCDEEEDGAICCKKEEANICPSPQEGTGGGFLMFKGSIVPCGRNCDDKNTPWKENESCTLCHFFIMFKQVYDLAFSLLIIVALALLTIGGVVYIVSAGNTNAKTLAKNIISKVLLGFALFLLSWLLVFTVLKFISANTDMLGNGEKWYEFDCDTESVFDKKGSSKK